MCSPKPSSPTTSFLPASKDPFKRTVDLPNHDEQQLHRLPTLSEVLEEIEAIGKISGPPTISSLLLYSRIVISMLFLGYLSELELAGGSLAIGVANITGYFVISGLVMGMEPICGQAYGAKQLKLLGLTLQRMMLLLLSASIPISFMWAYMKDILRWCGQDQEISSMAHTFIMFSIPDLFFLSFLHPLRVYLRAQSITLPVTYYSAISVLLHVPLNFLLVVHLKLGVAGVAIAMVWGWSSLLALALPTCASVCLEWWWYELMILLCALLINPKATIASMEILIQTTSPVYCFPSALSVGVSTRVGNKLGANRPGKARISKIVSLFFSLAIRVSAMLFTILMRHQWGKFFTSDAEILELTVVALPIVGLCELENCPQTTGCGVLRGTTRPTIGANIKLSLFYLVGMSVPILMGFIAKMGTNWMVQVERAKMLTQTNNNSNKLQSPLPISRKQEDPKDKNKYKADLEVIVSVNDEIEKPASSEEDPLSSNTHSTDAEH
ncbi:hypothetical protein V6N12_074878 [Hibiscus sabdariffa]|uniref:Protein DETOXIFICATION n=1 Tax=Hibiscus sabdariffa TaxID=183260 RepID=A0ABR2D336_9ROSI